MEVIGTEIFQDNTGPYTSFIVRASFGDKSWTLEKRFRDFHALDEALRTKLGKDAAQSFLQPLPSKFLPMVVVATEARTQQLNAYLTSLSIAVADLQSLGVSSAEDATVPPSRESQLHRRTTQAARPLAVPSRHVAALPRRGPNRPTPPPLGTDPHAPLRRS
jgi:hypothetical protein